jgi:uncharacterized RDD family membrane protein YckC
VRPEMSPAPCARPSELRAGVGFPDGNVTGPHGCGHPARPVGCCWHDWAMSMAPGWYPDPFSAAGVNRWWDGSQWTSATQVPSVTGWNAPPPYAGAQVETFALASWSRRLGAVIIDLLIISIVLLPVYISLLGPAFNDLLAAIPSDGSAQVPQPAITAFQDQVINHSLMLSLAFVVVSLVYVVPQNVAYGRTVGKRVLGIRIRMLADDRTPDLSTALIRWALFTAGTVIAGGPFLLLDGLWPLWDKPWRQALHDKLAKTVVVPTTSVGQQTR